MHDYFEIVGVSPDARPPDIRRACRRRASASHPDFRHDEAAPTGTADAALARDPAAADLTDAAIDFVDMSSVVDRMQQAFFGTTRSRTW